MQTGFGYNGGHQLLSEFEKNHHYKYENVNDLVFLSQIGQH